MRIENFVDQAEFIARVAHAGQVDRGGKDYIEHVARVVIEAEEISHTQGLAALRQNIIATAWLHDVIEDTKITPAHLFQWGMPDQVRWSVQQLTRSQGMPYDEYIAYIENHGTAITLVVKLADLRDHLTGHGGPVIPSLVPRYERALGRIEPLVRRL